MSGANANQRLSHMEAPRLRVSLLILSLLAALALPGAGAGSGTAAAGEAGSFGAKWERRVFGLTNPKMEKVLEALRAGRTGRAAGLARRLSASSREDRRLYGAILAARVALTQSRAEAADEHVASALETSETLAERSPALALELGRYQLARGRAHEALALFDRVRERHPGPARKSLSG